MWICKTNLWQTNLFLARFPFWINFLNDLRLHYKVKPFSSRLIDKLRFLFWMENPPHVPAKSYGLSLQNIISVFVIKWPSICVLHWSCMWHDNCNQKPFQNMLLFSSFNGPWNNFAKLIIYYIRFVLQPSSCFIMQESWCDKMALLLFLVTKYGVQFSGYLNIFSPGYRGRPCRWVKNFYFLVFVSKSCVICVYGEYYFYLFFEIMEAIL